jgi:L-ribulose-5-phosphate 3-epimerase
MKDEGIPRRLFLEKTTLAAVMAFTGIATAEQERQRYRIGVCDWMLLKRQKLGAFQLTKELGASSRSNNRD